MSNGGNKKRKNDYLLGIDLGATKILAAVVTSKGKVEGKAKLTTPVAYGPDVVIESMADAAKRAIDAAGVKAGDVAAVGVGSPGPLDPVKGVVYNAPNLGWDEVPLSESLAQTLKRPVFVHNDVDSGTYGEFKLGAGKGAQDMVGIFPGTGIGGGVILGGKLRTGFRGAAGEVGHVILLAGGPVCGCGKHGCAEAIASRLAIERDIRLAVENGRETVITELVNLDAAERVITSGVLARALEAGDRLVTETLARAAYHLGVLAANVVNLLDVERVVFGGGLIEACGAWLMPAIRESAYQHFIYKRNMDRVHIVAAELGDFAAVLGAALLAGDRLKRG